MSPAGPANLTVVPAQADPTTPLPAVLVLPGGGYGQTSAHEAEPVAEWLAKIGIHAFVLRYRVAPERHPAPLTDAKEAMLWIRGGSHGLAVDTDRVGVLGFSAGGHLAATLATAAATGNAALDVPGAVPNLSILCYPVISFTDAVHQGSIDNLLGHAPSSGLIRELSPELNVTSAAPPSFLWHTASDGVVPLDHSLAYVRALVRAGVPAELHVFPHGEHGLGLALADPGADQWTGLCERWLARQGWVD